MLFSTSFLMKHTGASMVYSGQGSSGRFREVQGGLGKFMVQMLLAAAPQHVPALGSPPLSEIPKLDPLAHRSPENILALAEVDMSKCSGEQAEQDWNLGFRFSFSMSRVHPKTRFTQDEVHLELQPQLPYFSLN
jgi:hypothetical protein